MPSKPGRPPTSGTRKGNGPGYGGPAKGKTGQPGRPKGMKTGEGKAARSREALEAATPLAIETVIAIAGNISDQRALAAAFGILNRVGLHEKAETALTGKDGAPLAVQVYLPDNGRD